MATAELHRVATLGASPRRFGLISSVVLVVVTVGSVAWFARSDPERVPAPLSADLAPLAVEAKSSFQFNSVGDMITASDLVVVGRVVVTERGRLVGDPLQGGVVSRLVTVQVDASLWNPAQADSSVVMVDEEGWLPDGTPIVVNGMQPSVVGDVGVWFLDRIPTDESPTYLVINSQGRFIESDGVMRGADQRDALVQELQRLSMGELRAMVESAVRNQQ